LNEESLKGPQDTIAKLIIDNLFQHKINGHVKKHKLLVRKILTRLIKKCGLPYMMKIMPEFHRPMITYIERQKRKTENKKTKDRLVSLMGEEGEEQGMKEDDSDGLSSDEEETEIAGRTHTTEVDSEDSESEDETAASLMQRGIDNL